MGFWATAAVAGGVAPAGGGGGGDSMEPARDRYEPGQTVTMIGYGFVVVDRPPYEGAAAYHGFLRRAGHDGDGGTPSGTDLGWPGRRLGPATIDEVEPHWGRNVRVSVEFSLPDDLAPGVYEVDVCTSGCDAPLGSFLPSPVHVGMDAPWPVTRDWPLSDPAIRWLEDDALIGTVGGTVTAADVRAGRAVDPPPGMQAPLPEEAAAPAAPDSPPVQAAGSASSGSAGGTTGRSGATSPADGPTGAADVVATDEPGTGDEFAQDPAWQAANLVTVDLPIIGTARCHRGIVDALAGALDEVVSANLAELIDPDGFAGCWNARTTRAGTSISRHAWGVAVDLNFGDNPTGLSSVQDERLLAIFSRWGLTDGSGWLVPDAGHFEYVAPPRS